MYFSRKNFIVFYGSQTGNAQDVAERIWRESRCNHFTASSIIALDNYNITQLPRTDIAIFICSTTGQGDTPTNMRLFWKRLLRKDLPNNWLENVRFGVFGLGDSAYVKFNFVAKKLQRRLLQLGAVPILDLGLGDDQHDLGYDATVDPWINTLWERLFELFPLPDNVQPLSLEELPLCRWCVTTNNSSGTDIGQNSEKALYTPNGRRKEIPITVCENIRITSIDHFQDVRLLKFQAHDGLLSYLSGDVISLRPKNLPIQIEYFKTILRENHVIFPDEMLFKIDELDGQQPVPDVLKNGGTFQQLCEEYFDLSAVPRRHTFEILARLTDSDLEREKCHEFTTALGQQDLYSYCNRPRRTIIEVLEDFPNATKNLTAPTLFEVLPSIRVRDFSIASSQKRYPNQVHVLLAVVRYRTKLVKERFGLCSNYLANLQSGDVVLASLKRGSFRFPTGRENVILIGPGTGMAPFRSFIQDRVISGQATAQNTILFFGCRFIERDFLCREEFEAYSQNGNITLVTAFSRHQTHKIYVQDKIIENGKIVWTILKSGGYIFVAGSAKSMPQQVREAFLTICQKIGNLNENEAEDFLRNMEKTNRYQTECWS